MAKKKEHYEGEALNTKLAELREEMRVTRFAFGGPSVKNVKQTRTTRREVARLLTMQRAAENKATAK